MKSSTGASGYDDILLTSQPDRNAPHLINVIKESTAKVVVVIAFDSDFVVVVEELLRQNVSGHIWVASEAWATFDLLSEERFKGILLSTIGFAIFHGNMLKIKACAAPDSNTNCRLFKEAVTGYLSRPGDIIMGGTFLIHLDRVYSDIQFTSKPPELQCQMFAIEYYQSMQALIFAVEEINSNPELLPNITLGYDVLDTCYTLRRAAQGTLSMLSGGTESTPNYNCHQGTRLAGVVGDSASTRTILMAQILGLYQYPQISYFATSPVLSDRNLFPSFFRTLLQYIKKVNFKTPAGNRVFFDESGNPPAIYDIVNWHLTSQGSLGQITVGKYDLSAPNGKSLNVDNGLINWASKTQIPVSKCSPSCPSGFRKVIVPGKPPCCYECARCPQGQISNQTDAVECHPCSWDTWPNLQQDRCLPRPTEFLSYEQPLGYSLAAISIFSSFTPITILGVLIRYNKTPIVRANNYSLSCLLLLSLFLCFLCSLGFIGYPQPEKCLLRQVAFGMVFALCISCVLAKTITVVIAFNATKPGSRLRKWTGVKVSYCVIGFCALIQILDCALWLIFSPPFHELDTDIQPGVIIANCNEGSPTAFWCMLGYLGLLASISFIVAFLARRLPDSFNEAKLITFSMLAFLSVWVSFIPAYLSARGMYTVAMEVFAILSSSWAVVGCIFLPKCFIILFRPNLNSREHLIGKRTA
ncbi:vomeronasal type-2 receptor 26 [Xenopus tropicalis]|uniref:Vomeronasal type-2 receptor 26 n=1 Tax=Xenopus tropicalis TaxID=8364 RepID=A0A8J1J8H2_XENTR|nr:vomeronasal type-2 receptor 26 [Xenopus tropicalis]